MQTLTIDDVTVRFGKVRALESFALELHAGQVVMLAGPNGAGKSTLIRVLLGLVSPDRGALRVDGRLVRVDRAFRNRLAYLPESVAFAESLTGREVVAFFASARGVARARVDEVLERVGLADARRRAVRGYSRGMRQRLGLAVALVAPSDLLILDEPTGGLDQDALSLLWSVLDEWRAAGRIVLLASHEIALLEHRVDRLALLSEGRRVAEGTPADLRRTAGLPLRVQLELDPAAPTRDALKAALGEMGAPRFDHDATHVELELEPHALVRLFELGAERRAAIRDLRVVAPPFDEVYRRLLSEAA
ncbi:MAG: ABC transporter ATP-binding protein [Myxococcales bacterium]|nr:ABC transporter ATP-binding protein [Myxococcales bacterium]